MGGGGGLGRTEPRTRECVRQGDLGTGPLVRPLGDAGSRVSKASRALTINRAWRATAQVSNAHSGSPQPIRASSTFRKRMHFKSNASCSVSAEVVDSEAEARGRGTCIGLRGPHKRSRYPDTVMHAGVTRQTSRATAKPTGLRKSGRRQNRTPALRTTPGCCVCRLRHSSDPPPLRLGWRTLA